MLTIWSAPKRTGLRLIRSGAHNHPINSQGPDHKGEAGGNSGHTAIPTLQDAAIIIQHTTIPTLHDAAIQLFL